MGRAYPWSCSASICAGGLGHYLAVQALHLVTLAACMGGSYALCARMPGGWLGLAPRVLVVLVVPNLLNLAVYSWGKDAAYLRQYGAKAAAQAETKGGCRMTKIGMLYICTGKYTVFWPEFYRSFEEKFLPGCEKEYFVFTDAPAIEYEDAPRVHRIYQEAYPWPYSTLKRFSIFLTQEDCAVREWIISFSLMRILPAQRPLQRRNFCPGPSQGRKSAARAAAGLLEQKATVLYLRPQPQEHGLHPLQLREGLRLRRAERRHGGGVSGAVP